MGLSLRLLEPAAGKEDVPVAEGLHAALRLVYGEAAAYGVLDDIGALSQARSRALGAQLGTGKEAAAAAAALELYYSVLCALARPFSAAVADDLGAAMPPLAFGWKSGLDGATEVARSAKLTVERAAVLFNLAAAHCACGSLLPKTDPEQIKTAARHFQVAAGILDEVAALDAATVLGSKPPPPVELQPEIARALTLAMLARAQECFCEKAEADGMAAGTRIKLLLGCRDAYASAADAITTATDMAPTAAPLKRLKAWAEPPCRAKQHAAETRALWLAATPTPPPPVGMALALARRAHAAAVRAAAAAPALPDETSRRGVTDLAGEIADAVAKLGRDNDTVYYESVPSEDSLPALQGKVLAKAVPIIVLVEAAEALPVPPAVWGGGGGKAAKEADELSTPSPAALFLSLAGLPRASKSAIAKLIQADAAEVGAPKAQEQAGGFLRGLWGGSHPAVGLGRSASSGSADGKSGEGKKGEGKSGESKSGDGKSGGGGDGGTSKNEQVSRVQQILAKGREQRGGESPGSNTGGGGGNTDGGGGKGGAAGGGAGGVTGGGGGGAGKGDETMSEDDALQAAIAASLSEHSIGSAPAPAPPRAFDSRTSDTATNPPSFSSLLRRPGRQPSSGSDGPSPPPPPPVYSAPVAPPPPSYTGGGGRGGASLPPPPSFEASTATPTPAAFESMLSQLSALGFGRDRAAEALRRANYDTAAAADLLFGG